MEDSSRQKRNRIVTAWAFCRAKITTKRRTTASEVRITLWSNFAVWMQNNPQAQVSLDGHASEADDSSQALATKRVAAVRAELIRLGVSPSRITVGTYGKQASVCSRTTDTCLELNRRVEILAVRS